MSTDNDDKVSSLTNKNISFFYHLEELRWIIIKIVIALIATAVVSYIFKDHIFDAIISPLKGLNVTIIHLKVYEKFMAYIKLAVYSGLILAFPLIIYYISKFVMPALYRNEKKWYLIGMFFVVLLFFSGSFLSYRVLAPISINFLLSFGLDDEKKIKDKGEDNVYQINEKDITKLAAKISLSEKSVKELLAKESALQKQENKKVQENKSNTIRIANELVNIIDIQKKHNKVFLSLNDNLSKLGKVANKIAAPKERIASYLSIGEYIDWIVVFIFMVGVVFQLPLVISLLAKIGIVNERMLIRFRPYALVLILVVGAIITPPDWVSQVIVALPVYALYEISILLTMIIRKRAKYKEDTVEEEGE